jgi:hypothetical protein
MLSEEEEPGVVQPVKKGNGEGAFVVVRGKKQNKDREWENNII